RSDAYFNLSGVTYSTSQFIGTENTIYYKTLTDFDTRGRQSRSQAPTGTISRTWYDSLSRVSSTWIGLDDTPTSGSWSPTNTAGTDLEKVSENEYDSAGIGDSLLTKSTQLPAGSASDPNNRVAKFYYDWRDRTVAVKSGVEASESTSLNRP